MRLCVLASATAAMAQNKGAGVKIERLEVVFYFSTRI